MRRTALLLMSTSLLLLSQVPASAGGWWTDLDLDSPYLGIGESFTTTAPEVLFDSIEAAERAERDQYYAYLVTDFDHRSLERATERANPGDWWRPVGPVFQAGTVTLIGRDANLARGRVHVTVPEIAPGPYWLMLCDLGCRTPLANHTPVPVTVTADALAAETARRLNRSNERMSVALDRVRRDLQRTNRKLRQVRADAAAVADAVAEPKQAPASDRDTSGAPWLPYAGWFVAGAAVSFMLVRRRRKAGVPEIIIERVPDDARELTKAP